MSHMGSDPFRPLKNALGRFATGIAIVSCLDEQGAWEAITVNSFTSVSLDPALVLWCLDKQASRYDQFMAASHYGISILRSNQQAVSDQFAGRLGKQAWPATISSPSGLPLIADSLAVLDCRVHERHEAGDHIILIGEVEWFQVYEGEPLLYFASQYAKGPHSKTV